MRNHSQFQSLIKEELVSVVDLHAVDALVDLAQPKTAIVAEVVALLAMAIGAGRDGNTCIDIEALPKLPVVAGVSWPTSTKAWKSLLSSCTELVQCLQNPRLRRVTRLFLMTLVCTSHDHLKKNEQLLIIWCDCMLAVN